MAYKENHYVPIWYQKKFIPKEQKIKNFFLLDLNPEIQISKGHKYTCEPIRSLGPKKCFISSDLYTTKGNGWKSTEIEQKFFGKIDRQAKKSIDSMNAFAYNKLEPEVLRTLLMYMSVQKMRTPKGLKYLSKILSIENKNTILFKLQELQHLHCALWSECIWSIADATQSNTKFIISDHPVTVYNMECFPMSEWCRDGNDPDINLIGTHTLFPISLNKIIILTNLTWVKRPNSNPLKQRLNPNPFRNSIMDTRAIQTERMLSELEVNQINYVIKKRALKYIAATKKEWLFPEEWLNESKKRQRWDKLGEGYLFMPDPRLVIPTSELIIGYGNHRSESYDEYGQTPAQKEYASRHRQDAENKSLANFQAKFEKIFGKSRRGRNGYD